MDVIGICVALVAAILGAGYPILLQVSSRLNEKYDSEMIITLFENEPIKKRFETSLFYLTLPMLLINYLVGIILPDLYSICTDYLWLENVGEALLVLFTINLVYQFYRYIRLCMIYYRPEKLTQHIIRNHVF